MSPVEINGKYSMCCMYINVYSAANRQFELLPMDINSKSAPDIKSSVDWNLHNLSDSISPNIPLEIELQPICNSCKNCSELLSIWLSIKLPIWFSLRSSISLSISFSIHLWIGLSIRLSIWLAIKSQLDTQSYFRFYFLLDSQVDIPEYD